MKGSGDRQILYSQLQEGKQNQERFRLRFHDAVKENIKQMNIDKTILQKKAKSRDDRRSLIRPKWRQSLSHRRTADDDGVRKATISIAPQYN